MKNKRIIISYDTEKSKNIILEDLKDILESCKETGRCLARYADGIQVFVEKKENGYKIKGEDLIQKYLKE
jgi:hypothetical protein